jgi:hypothetical protein
MMALVAGIFAQTCVSLLPLPNAEIEWFRDGRPFARDVPVSETSTGRVYRRHHENGRTSERVVSCTSTRGVSWLEDRVRGDAAVRLPVTLRIGAVTTDGGATVRRIEPPADAGRAAGTLWFSVTSPGVAIYGVSARTGIIEIRTPSSSGGFSILRAVRRDPAQVPAADSSLAADTALAEAEARNRELIGRIGRLEVTQLTLLDSLSTLTALIDSMRRVPYSPDNVVELGAVDVYVERGEYDAAIELLLSVTRRLHEWSETAGTRHRALDAVDARLHQVIVRCAAAAAARAPRSRPVTCALDGGS